jgi:CdiI immunity protein
MKIENLKNFNSMIGCYFNQDFGFDYPNLNETIQGIIFDYHIESLASLFSEINIVLNYTESEKNLADILLNKFDIGVYPYAKGIELNTYTEFLEYIRDKIKAHLESKGVKINEEENN